MTSLPQIEANRRNAFKSTGPKTELGKQHSRCNATRHGLTAETVIQFLEDEQDYKKFELSVTSDFDARTAVDASSPVGTEQQHADVAAEKMHTIGAWGEAAPTEWPNLCAVTARKVGMARPAAFRDKALEDPEANAALLAIARNA